MERDFLGLLTVKEENIDVTVDSARGTESGMQWSFVNNISGPSQYLSFRPSQEDRTRKNVHDQFDSNQKLSATGAQGVVTEKSAGTHYPIPAYRLQHFSTHSMGRSHETRMFPSSNQPITVTMSPPTVHSHISPITISPQSLGGVSVLPPVSVLPTTDSVIGSPDLRNGNKQHAGWPAQLTIFYAGSVNVFDDVSPDKAQAIMLLAGNRPSVAHHKALPAPEVSAPFKKLVTDEAPNGNITRPPAFPSLPGAVSVGSRPVSQSPGKPICSLELATVKSTGPLKSPVITQQEPSRVIQSLGSPSTPLFSTAVALPQARKASLARFLEKRKDRVMSTSPYPVINKYPESSICKVSDN